ncbi:MAG: hypothetical protein AAF283_06985, partial [Cyanobacteria bacterium P01_A01_bin.70]
LAEGTTAVDAAMQKYQAAVETQPKMAAAADWQAGMDVLNEIPPETLAGRLGQTKLAAYQRDFSQVSGLLAGGNRTSTLIEAAEQFAWTASTEAQNPPHSAETWARIAGLWQQAIARLEQVPVEDVGYTEAQAKLADYQNKLGYVEEQQISERRSRQALDSALAKNTDLGKRLNNLDQASYASELQSIVNELNKVAAGTTAYEPAQQLLRAVQDRLREVAATQS